MKIIANFIRIILNRSIIKERYWAVLKPEESILLTKLK